MNYLSKLSIAALFCAMTLISGETQKMALPFNITPDMYAEFMAKSLEGNLPHTFKHKELSLSVNRVYTQSNKVFFQSTTKQYQQILNELYTYKTLPDDLKKQCKDFSKVAMVDKGVEYYLSVEEGSKKFIVVYDKEACGEQFDPAKKIFIGGYNRYGYDMNGRTKIENQAKKTL